MPADLAVGESLGDQLQHLELTARRILLWPLKRRQQRESGGYDIPARTTSSQFVEAAGMVGVAVQNLFALDGVHTSEYRRMGQPA